MSSRDAPADDVALLASPVSSLALGLHDFHFDGGELRPPSITPHRVRRSLSSSLALIEEEQPPSTPSLQFTPASPGFLPRSRVSRFVPVTSNAWTEWQNDTPFSGGSPWQLPSDSTMSTDSIPSPSYSVPSLPLSSERSSPLTPAASRSLSLPPSSHSSPSRSQALRTRAARSDSAGAWAPSRSSPPHREPPHHRSLVLPQKRKYDAMAAPSSHSSPLRSPSPDPALLPLDYAEFILLQHPMHASLPPSLPSHALSQSPSPSPPPPAYDDAEPHAFLRVRHQRPRPRRILAARSAAPVPAPEPLARSPMTQSCPAFSSLGLGEHTALALPRTDPDLPSEYPYITTHTGAYSEAVDTVYVLDARYNYEFVGGHIRSAHNFPEPDDAITYFLGMDAPSHPCIRTVIVCHCEFSSKRGPELIKRLRSADRRLCFEQERELVYPELYLLKGGYAQFFADYSALCEPCGYVRMYDEEHKHELHSERRALRRRQLKRSSSLNGIAPLHIPTDEDDDRAYRNHVRELANRHGAIYTPPRTPRHSEWLELELTASDSDDERAVPALPEGRAPLFVPHLPARVVAPAFPYSAVPPLAPHGLACDVPPGECPRGAKRMRRTPSPSPRPDRLYD